MMVINLSILIRDDMIRREYNSFVWELRSRVVGAKTYYETAVFQTIVGRPCPFSHYFIMNGTWCELWKKWTVKIPVPTTSIWRLAKTFVPNMFTHKVGGMVRLHNNMELISIEETWRITLINLYLSLIQNHWKTIVVRTKWKLLGKSHCCSHLKTLCLFLSFSMSILRYNHHLAPVAQSVRASYL